ncbi:hypothetical protein KIH87_11895 [Paraneptunicella aestuarii]|uniref:ABC transporter six-transmembrane domain-containing protein n=1 Tax=Paraneptunicella aestuarii TaxID=2831148 RepID=UPI001E5BD901|nr:ABC transporter six-transmembrane domain-containing protein [Paraneptunicella aestuarii]UAA37416.1 hypothetical protein KIH87_11895 [Paraneptunicella aestuarii]
MTAITSFSTDYSLWGIFKRFTWPIVGTFVLVVLENLVFISQPYLIGKSVDGLIEGSFDQLYVYIGIMVIFVFMSTFRRIYDTRTYANIRAKLSIETVSHQRNANSSLSATSERTALCDEILGFFEAGLFVIVKSFVEIIGSLVMLAFIDIKLCIAAFCAMVVIQCIWYGTRPYVRDLFTQRNNQREKKVQEIESGNNKRIKAHFLRLAKIKIGLSNYEALSFGAFQIIGISVFIYAAYVTTGLDTITAGLLYTCLNYVTSLNNAIIRLPNVFHSIVGVNEISKRLQHLAPLEANAQKAQEEAVQNDPNDPDAVVEQAKA